MPSWAHFQNPLYGFVVGMVGCYIIFSKKLNRFYIGATQDGVENRLKKHNDHFYADKNFTAKASDWELFLFIDCATFSQAVRIERHIKKMKSAVFIRNLLKHPEIIAKLKMNN